MKKVYFFLLGAMMATAAFAQKLQSVQPDWNLYSPQSASAPMKAASLEGTDIWGYYTAENFANDATIILVGMEKPCETLVGYVVPCDNLTRNSKIQGVRLPIYDPSCLTSAEVRIYDGKGKNILASKSVTPSSLKQGYNDVVLDEPYEITEEIIVAYDIVTKGTTQGAMYPILVASEIFAENSFLIFDTFKNTGEISDLGTKYGCLLTQLYVSDLNLNGYDFTLDAFKGYTSPNAEFNATVSFTANLKEAVSDVDYTVSVAGGEPVEHHTTLSVASGLYKTGSFPITFTAPEALGSYTVEVKVTKVNGSEESVSSNVAKGSFVNMGRIIPRSVVMEEYTGTGCGWCPRGIVGMEKGRDAYGDRFVGVAYHFFNNTDPMYPSAYPRLGWSGAPSCFLDRSGVEYDPYYGSGSDVCDDIDELLEVPAFVDLDVTAAFTSEDLTSVDITAEVDAVVDGTYEMVYILTADGLTGASFLQNNGYAQYTAAQWGLSADDPLAAFCKGGEYGKSPCKPIFNDVCIAASYTSNVSKGDKLTLAKDEVKSSSYTLKMPVKANLLNAIKDANYDVYAVVIAVNADKTVANSKRVKVSFPAGIDEITVNNDATEVARYTLDGRRISVPTSGVNVVRMSDGSCHKVFVK